VYSCNLPGIVQGCDKALTLQLPAALSCVLRADSHSTTDRLDHWQAGNQYVSAHTVAARAITYRSTRGTTTLSVTQLQKRVGLELAAQHVIWKRPALVAQHCFRSLSSAGSVLR
jgi:hypothetical protein